ncbi:cyclic peptide export ABC transporter [Cohnella cellulosilytica]|uniref:cyclic peptide export ABC transporter n=1 Tax=Cohnella cellulosilytica TaxID=986710 RepID=UPI00366ED404
MREVNALWVGLPGLAIVGNLIGLGAVLRGIRKNKRVGESQRRAAVTVQIAFGAVFYGWLGYCVARLWADASLTEQIALGGTYAAFALFGVYLALTAAYPKPKERPYGTMLLLSIASGVGNASMIFVVNAAIAGNGTFSTDLLPFFVLGMLGFVCGQKLLRSRLIRMTNGIVYDKRMEVLNVVLNAPYANVEAMERGKIEACLNNDTETVSSFSNRMVSVGTWSVTILAGFAYLAALSLAGFLFSLAVVFVASGAFFVILRSANRLWEQTRDIQNVFFKFIQDLIYGFKELYLNRRKARDFRDDMELSCASYRDKRSQAEVKVANVVVIGDLLFASVIGTVVFAFPHMLPGIGSGELRSFVFVFLYMAGPLTSILNTLPDLFQARISWRRIRKFTDELSELGGRTDAEAGSEEAADLRLRLEQAIYEYSRGSERSFSVGPIDYEFRSGELVFVIGGNGSGKSTLAKLVTGLYEPNEGSVTLNGNRISAAAIGDYVSTIFSDAYLFDRLYGIDFEAKAEEARHYLNVLGLQDKVAIEGGRFSTTRLSTGQRKRLALLVSYLDDKPICLFDEWAADQDPEYREYFYTTLLPELRNKGKCVIVITHDDRYFGMADKLIKLEMGKIA